MPYRVGADLGERCTDLLLIDEMPAAWWPPIMAASPEDLGACGEATTFVRHEPARSGSKASWPTPRPALALGRGR